MARYKISSGETRTDVLPLTTGDSLIVAAGATLRQITDAAAVTLSGTGSFVRNFGLIETQGDGFAVGGTLSGAIDVTIRNEAGATIRGGDGGIDLESDSGSTGGLRFYNAGLVEGGTTRAVNFKDLLVDSIYIENAAGGVITNDGSADVVRPGNDGAAVISIVNAGTIRAGVVAGASSSGDAIDLQPEDGGNEATVLNSGTGVIEGGKHGITGANTAVITNLVGGQIIGRNGSGINFDTEAADGDGYVTVVNSGTISGRYDGFGDGDGDGVDVDYLVDVKNRGTIEGVGADNVDDFGDGIAAGGGIIRNYAAGLIHGETNGILIDDGDRNGAYAATTINNAGTISGGLNAAVQLIGSFDDRIVNTGTISGSIYSIDMGDGDDRIFNAGILDGIVRLGSGSDVFRTIGDGSVEIVDGDAGDDRILGGDGSQTIAGGEGRDVLSGGGGDDTFLFNSVADSNRATGVDRITDLASGDSVDLAGIDADTTADGDQAFTMVGTSAFSGIAGELRIQASATSTVMMGDVDGDSVADFVLAFTGTIDPVDLATAIIL